MSNSRALDYQNDSSTEASPGRRQMNEQLRPSSLDSPSGYGPGRASRDMEAFALGRVQRGGAQRAPRGV